MPFTPLDKKISTADKFQDPHHNTERRILRRAEILARTGLSDVTIWRMERSGNFPKRVRLGGNSCGWFSDEYEAWLAQKGRERFFNNTKEDTQ